MAEQSKKPLYEIFREVINEKRYEPKPRWCGGTFGPVSHRFPIKGGISWREVLVQSQYNSLFSRVKVK